MCARRRAQCEQLFGPALTALHAAAAPSDALLHAGAADGALYWTRLWRAADAMDGGYYLNGASECFEDSLTKVTLRCGPPPADLIS